MYRKYKPNVNGIPAFLHSVAGHIHGCPPGKGGVRMTAVGSRERMVGLVGAVLFAATPGLSAPNDPIEFFKTRVRPILAEHCFACHTNLKSGGLQLDSREHMLTGGNSGPAIVVGNPEQ